MTLDRVGDDMAGRGVGPLGTIDEPPDVTHARVWGKKFLPKSAAVSLTGVGPAVLNRRSRNAFPGNMISWISPRMIFVH